MKNYNCLICQNQMVKHYSYFGCIFCNEIEAELYTDNAHPYLFDFYIKINNIRYIGNYYIKSKKFYFTYNSKNFLELENFEFDYNKVIEMLKEYLLFV